MTLSLAAVFRDVLPGYRVNEKALAGERTRSDAQQGGGSAQRVRTRAAPESVVRCSGKGVKDEARAEASARCAASVVAAGHFNYRREAIACW